MAQPLARDEDCTVRTLQEMCCSVVMKTVTLSADLLCGLPAPIVEDLAVGLSPSQLLKLEEALKNETLLEKAWQQRCEKQWYRGEEPMARGHPHRMTSWSSSAVRSQRDLWLKSYVSRYLLQHFNTWNPQQAETHARGFLFLGREQECVEQFPPLLFEEFLHHTVNVARLVKEISVRSRTLHKLTQHPQIIQALKTNLLALKVDFLKNTDFLDFLLVLKELMSDGQLRSLNLINICQFFDDWQLLFFMANGAFHCKMCASRFSAGLVTGTSAPAGSSFHPSDTEAVCVTNHAETGDEYQSFDQRIESVAVEPYPSVVLDLRQSVMQHRKSSSVKKNLTSANGTFSGKELGSDTEINRQEHSAHTYLSGLLPPRVLNALNELHYSGLRGCHRPPDDLDIGAACTFLTDDDFQRSTVNSNTEREIDMGGGSSNCYDIDQTLVGEAEGIAHNQLSAVERTVGDDATDEEDLLNEALGVSTATQLTAPVVPTSVQGDSSHLCESAFGRLTAELGHLHSAEQHASCGIKDLSLMCLWPAESVSCSQTLGMLRGLRNSLPGWVSLSLLHLDMAVCSCLSEELSGVLQLLVLKIEQMLLRSLSISLHQELKDSHEGLDFAVLEQFFWQLLQKLASSTVIGSQPMKLLRISIVGDRTTFKDKSVSIAGKNHFHALQELSLNEVCFEDWESFRPLAEYISCDQALGQLSLQHCAMDAASAQHLFSALSLRDCRSVTHIDLQGSLMEVTEGVWEKVCCAVEHLQSLTFLSLADCSLTEHQVNSSHFVSAIRKHGTERKLTLDLSSIHLGDAVWEFMSSTVCPGSSLKGFYFMRTGCRLGTGLVTVRNILQDSLDHLPLLHCCCFTAEPSCSVGQELQALLQQISQKVHTYSDSLTEEHLAMM